MATAQTSGELWPCLKAKFPGMERAGGAGGKTAYDPDSGRNFAFEDNAWIDIKTGESICPKRRGRPTSGELWPCLKARFPGMERAGGAGGKTAYDPDSGRNFAFEDNAWIDVKTGEAICPKRARRAGGPTIELNLGFGDRRRTDDGEDTLFGGGERDRPCSGIGIGGFGIGGCADDD